MARNNYDEKKIIMQLREEQTRAGAFSAVVEMYSEQIYWHIRRMVFSHEDTNDLVQETFIKAWTNIGKFRGESQISTWLYRIAINETLTFLSRNQQVKVPIDTAEGAVADTIESDAYFNGDRADALFQEAISRLPAKQRLAFNMKYFEEMKYEEMSELLDTSVGALKASYHIAVKKIEEFLKEND